MFPAVFLMLDSEHAAGRVNALLIATKRFAPSLGNTRHLTSFSVFSLHLYPPQWRIARGMAHCDG